MTRKLLFDIVTIGAYVLPICFALIVVALPRPRSALLRSVVGVVAAWAASVGYTIYVFNPAGIAAGHELGMDSPQTHFDNNTVAVQLIMGWLLPALGLAAFFAIRRIWLQRASLTSVRG